MESHTVTISDPATMRVETVHSLAMPDTAWHGFSLLMEDATLTFYSPLEPQQFIAIILQKLQECEIPQ